MNSDRPVLAAIAVLTLAGCQTDQAGLESASYGEANRRTFAAQVIDPEPQYDTLVPESSAEHASQAIDRYRKDQVKKPDKISTTTRSGEASGR